MTLYYDFSALLLVASLVTGLITLGDYLFFRQKRKAGIPANGVVDFAKAIFPILLLVFLLRAVVFEPFRIPTGSMKPSLLEGDFILVNKYIYGIRLPLSGKKMISISEPKRGEVMVFRYPKDTSVYFIKRVVGVPGDIIKYENKILYINGKPMNQNFVENTMDVDLSGRTQEVKELVEDLDNHAHKIWLSLDQGHDIKELVVPAGHYFMMGDNRDASEDSRYWGFVSDDLLIGRASRIWMSWDGLNKVIRWKRIGYAI